ncbi:MULTISPECIES: Flp pilus assembly protein CpaB [unclassified Streptomyces]|uniref:Flp pilus assembly protein CpaB n=1 Tax=unclassified Streptomyces TaxID=2593676 RepID=UPI0019089DF3|nr:MULTISPECIES: Flp pilus assembly protein CpaB [unclassified Streptomyces]MCU4746963.1 Flp pilus assembly protein CpaB [Streptomyces sp. G-5]QQN77651.1 Flp pilus assembly protein CpaB [Streptomyces sp. XC 2026]
MNARQRRGSLLLIVSVLLALGAFAGVVAVINDVESKVGPEVTAYELSEDVEPYTELHAAQLREVTIPERYIPDSAVTELSQIEGKVAVSPLREGSLLQQDMISDRPELAPGQQEIAVLIDASTGVAGKIYPGAKINLYAAFRARDTSADDSEEMEFVRLMVNNAEVIEVGDLTEVEEDRRTTQAVPITFALDHLDAERVTFAEAFAEQVRLALVAPGEEQEIPEDERTYTIVGDMSGNPHSGAPLGMVP